MIRLKYEINTPALALGRPALYDVSPWQAEPLGEQSAAFPLRGGQP